MLAALGVLVVSAAIIMLEVPYLLRSKLKKELVLFSVLLFLGAVLHLAIGLHIAVPNPLEGLIYIFQPLSELLFGIMD